HKRIDLGGGTWLTNFQLPGDDARGLSVVVYSSPPQMSLYPESFEPVARVMIADLFKLLKNNGELEAQPAEKTKFRDGTALRADFTFQEKGKDTPNHSYLLALPGKRHVFVVGLVSPEKDAALLDTLKL